MHNFEYGRIADARGRSKSRLKSSRRTGSIDHSGKHSSERASHGDGPPAVAFHRSRGELN
eukprot:5739204-Pleurochrysis_carterae.AAC.1